MDKKRLHELYCKLAEKLGADNKEARMLKDILCAGENIAPRGGIRMADYVSKDKFRPVMCGVFYDKGNIVASDLYMLMNVMNQSYPESFEGKIIGKDGAEIEGTYPKWKSVFREEGTLTELKPDWDSVDGQFKDAKFNIKTGADKNPLIDFGPFKLKCKYAERLIGLRKSPGIDKVLYKDARGAVLVTGPSYRFLVMPYYDNYREY